MGIIKSDNHIRIVDDIIEKWIAEKFRNASSNGIASFSYPLIVLRSDDHFSEALFPVITVHALLSRSPDIRTPD